MTSPVIHATNYTTLEAAYYARMHPATVRSWLKGTLSQFENEDQLSFHEFVQLLAVRELRQKGISMAKIRGTMNYIRQECGIQHPFASNRHTTYTEDKELFIELEGEKGVFTATGKHALQRNFKPIVEFYMTQLEFDEQGLAKKYTAFELAGQSITLAPTEYYGMPIIEGTPYTAFNLAHAVECEGGIEAAAEVYGVEQEKIIAAMGYIDHLSTKPQVTKKSA